MGRAGGCFCDRKPPRGLTFRASGGVASQCLFTLSRRPSACGANRELVSLRGLTGPLVKPNLSARAPDCASERLQEDIMQANFKRGKVASGVRSVGRSVAILAGVPLIATLAFGAPNVALAACGASAPAGIHAAGGGGGGGGGVHVATSRVATSSGGGGGGSSGCPTGASAPALRGLPVAASGRVIETGGQAAGHTTTYARTAATMTATRRTAATTPAMRTANVGVHLPAVRSQRAVARR